MILPRSTEGEGSEEFGAPTPAGTALSLVTAYRWSMLGGWTLKKLPSKTPQRSPITMNQCPQCQTSLSELDRGQSRCPHCQAVLTPLPTAAAENLFAPTFLWDSEEDEQAESFSTVLPSPPAVMDTVDIAGGCEQTAQATGPFETGPVAADDTGSLDATTAVDPARPQPAQPSSDFATTESIHATWDGAIPKGAAPTASLKAGGGFKTGSVSSLSIQPRRLMAGGGRASGHVVDYEVVSILGKGGMGIVYSARQGSLDRHVAVKMLQGDGTGNQAARDSFLSEACVTGELEHPNIVPIYDLGQNSDGAYFYSMKQVHGTPWNKIIHVKSQVENVEILMRVCDAMAMAHSKGIIHRDLKPANTMIGEFGEVLVLDWGLAIPTDRSRKIGGIQLTESMAGTPSYMAPEMARGPYSSISPASDIYLLGAILFEIVTGHPPHTGGNAHLCMLAVARNDIIPTDVQGPLLDIAMRAMRTRQEERYASVQEFQDAIRQYQAHAESIALATNADENLKQGRETQDYEPLARSVFGFQEALAMWDGNERAGEGLIEARQAYADAAYARGDFDLAIGQLDTTVPAQAKQHADIVAARDERELRKSRLATYKRIGAALAASLFVIVTGAVVWIDNARRDADAQRAIAVEQKDIAIVAETKQRLATEQERIAKELALEAQEKERLAKLDAEKKRLAAEAAEEQARLAKVDADMKRQEAEVARAQAVAASEQERLAKLDADEKRKLAEQAQQQEYIARQAEAYESYVARIGAAAAKIDENAYDAARLMLTECIPPAGETDHRNWEWGRLWYLCEQAAQTIETPMPLETVAVHYSSDNQIAKIAAAGAGGQVIVWNRRGGDKQTLDTAADNVHCVAFSPTGDRLAIATDDPNGFIKLADLTSGQVSTFAASTADEHTAAVLSVEYSPSGKELLSASRDGKIKVWDVAMRTANVSLHGHRWWVWQARFVPPAEKSASPTRIVSVSQDATAIVWEDKTGNWSAADKIKQLPTFRGHQGPIFAVAISSDGKTIATAGQDRRILLWDDSDLEEIDLAKAVSSNQVQATRADYPELIGHTATIRSLSFAPTGKVLISGGHDNTVRIWNTSSNELVKTLRGHGRWVMSSVVSADGQTVVSAAMDHSVRLWDIAGYEEMRVIRGKLLAGHEDAILAADFSPSSDRIVTASRDRTVKTWDFDTGKELQTFHEGHSYFTSNATVFASGTRLATAAADNSVRVWDIATGAQLQLLTGTGTGAVVAASRDGQLLLTAGPNVAAEKSADKEPTKSEANWTAQTWNPKTGKLIHKLKGHRSMVSAVAISPDGKLLFTGDIGGSGRLWNAKDGSLVKNMDWHQAKVIAASFSDDGRYLITAGLERNVARWDLKTGEVQQDKLLVHTSILLSMDVDPSGRYVVTSCNDSKLRVWDFNSQQVIQTIAIDGNNASAQAIDRVAISPDASRVLAINHEQRSVRVYDSKTGIELQFPQVDGKAGPLVQMSSREPIWSAIFAGDSSHVLSIGGDQVRLWETAAKQAPFRRLRMNFSPHGVVASASFSTDGSEVISGSWDGTANVWNAKTGVSRLKLVGKHAAGVGCAVFSPDTESKCVLTTSDDGTAVLWDANNGKFIRRFAGHEMAIHWGAFNHDGTRILTASADGTVKVWDISDSAQPLKVLVHDSPVLRASFSPDGKAIASGSEDHLARIWDIEAEQILFSLDSHTAAVTSVAFTPDGRRLLTGSQDFMAKLWDTRTGKELLNLSGHVGEVTSVAFSASRLNAITASYDGTAIVWLAAPWDSRNGKPEPGALATLEQ